MMSSNSVFISTEVAITLGVWSVSSGFRIHSKTRHLMTSCDLSALRTFPSTKGGEHCCLCLETYPVRMFAQNNQTFIKVHSTSGRARTEGPHSPQAVCTSSVLHSAGTSSQCLGKTKYPITDHYLRPFFGRLAYGRTGGTNVGSPESSFAWPLPEPSWIQFTKISGWTRSRCKLSLGHLFPHVCLDQPTWITPGLRKFGLARQSITPKPGHRGLDKRRPLTFLQAFF